MKGNILGAMLPFISWYRDAPSMVPLESLAACHCGFASTNAQLGRMRPASVWVDLTPGSA